MADLKATLTETLRQHGELEDSGGTCECGWYVHGSDHAEHVADVLLGLSGVAVVDAEVYRVARKGLVDLTEAWAELRMDTPEDQSLHDRLVALSRTAAEILPLPKSAVVSEGDTDA